MSVIEEKCKQKGVRLTEQRRVIAKIMSESKLTFGSKDHPDVDELHKRVTLVDKKISIAEEHIASQAISDAIIRLQGIIRIPRKKIGKYD